MNAVGVTEEEPNLFKITEERILLIVNGMQYKPTIQIVQFIIVGKTYKGLITPKIFQLWLTKKQNKKEKTKQTPGPKRDFQ